MPHVDVLIIGAGLSGVGAAYHLQTNCPGKTYAILEARERLGGTWDLFKYPGIRSDSDMYTLGYVFKPWTDAKAIADGPSILRYVQDTAREYGIDRQIHYNEKVTRAEWADGQWTITAAQTWTCNFLYACSGYYDYDAGYTPELAGRSDFQGTIIHPQHWPEGFDYTGKRIVVIGSGATAVTLVPELAKQAAHVTMLQRSPTYIMTRPAVDKIADWLRAKLPAKAAYATARWKNILAGLGFYLYSRKFPGHAKQLLAKGAAQASGLAPDPHFLPDYNPWDQRLCLVPDGDLFESLKSGRAEIVTDHIERITPTGIQLKSGAHLDADVIVTATGLQMKMFGGAEVIVDGKRVGGPETMIYKGCMMSDVPNFAFAVGYTNASWTLKVDLTSVYVCRLINYLDAHHFTSVRAKRDPHMPEIPVLDFNSGYVKRALPHLPTQGAEFPWRVYQNYVKDRNMFSKGEIADDILQFQ
ncbi:MAG: NAD(P)/FAD-dependent oxidoreductase [Kofleriaceae bacterium]